jgi:hypothetical protein
MRYAEHHAEQAGGEVMIGVIHVDVMPSGFAELYSCKRTRAPGLFTSLRFYFISRATDRAES